MDFVYLTIIFAGGILAGLYGSSVGSAGMLSIPILILLGIPPHVAIATTRPAAIVLELVSAIRFYRDGKLTPELLKKGCVLGLVTSIGAYIGAVLLVETDEDLLRVLLSAVLLLTLCIISLKRNWGLEEQKHKQRQYVFIGTMSIILGIYGGFFGFAFGTLYTILIVFSGYTLMQSAVIARVTGVIISAVATVIFIQGDLILYPYAFSLATGFGIGGWIGAGIGAKRGNVYIKGLLSCVVLLSVAILLAEAFL